MQWYKCYKKQFLKLFVWLVVLLFVYLVVCLFVCLVVCLFIFWLFVYFFGYLFVWLLTCKHKTTQESRATKRQTTSYELLFMDSYFTAYYYSLLYI